MDTKLVILLVLGIVAIAWANPETDSDSDTKSEPEPEPEPKPGNKRKTSCYGTSKHSLYEGMKRGRDKLLHTELVHVSSADGAVAEKTLEWPPQGQKNKKTITYIKVVDQKHGQTGGCPHITAGGVGDRFVDIHMISQNGGGLDFAIHIYGH
uniref:Secreted venom protein family 3 protein n=1 Tax=Pristhesancus plagipennis TaxID=1955184 RepID=A0A2K8JMM5_PRIPG|nr:secreted venom protein family 3 protein [Pristhesancus plagipennis]